MDWGKSTTGTTATATHELSSDYSVNKLLDFNYNDYFHSGAGGEAVDVELNFNQNRDFREFCVDNRGYSCPSFTAYYWNGSSWVSFLTNAVAGTYYRFNKITSSKVKIVFDSGYARVVEINVFEYQNIASISGTTFNASQAEQNPAYPYSRMFDWNRATETYFYINTSLEFIFDVERTLNELYFIAHPSYRPTVYKVYYWNGSSYVQHLSITNESRTEGEITFSPVDTTKLKFEIINGNSSIMAFYELRVFGYTKPPPEPITGNFSIQSTLVATLESLAITNNFVNAVNYEWKITNSQYNNQIVGGNSATPNLNNFLRNGNNTITCRAYNSLYELIRSQSIIVNDRIILLDGDVNTYNLTNITASSFSVEARKRDSFGNWSPFSDKKVTNLS